jgi:hypothetical protein
MCNADILKKVECRVGKITPLLFCTNAVIPITRLRLEVVAMRGRRGMTVRLSAVADPDATVGSDWKTVCGRTLRKNGGQVRK